MHGSVKIIDIEKAIACILIKSAGNFIEDLFLVRVMVRVRLVPFFFPGIVGVGIMRMRAKSSTRGYTTGGEDPVDIKPGFKILRRL